MTANHGAATRRPVIYGGKPIRGLHVRTVKDGTEVYEARIRIDGKDCRVVLDGVTTATEALGAFENLCAGRNGVEPVGIGHLLDARLAGIEHMLRDLGERVARLEGRP